MRRLLNHILCNAQTLSEDTSRASVDTKESFENSIPPRIVGNLADHVHIYVDASYDPTRHSDLGGVMYDNSGNMLAFFSEKVDVELMGLINQQLKETII